MHNIVGFPPKILISLVLIGVQGFMDLEMAERYLAYKKVSYAVVIDCENNKRNQLRASKRLMLKGNRVLHLRFSSKLEENAFRAAVHTGVIVDGECDIAQLLVKCGKDGWFNYMNHWFVMGTNATLSLFENVDLKINADVNIVLYNKNRRTWSVLDVYNPYFGRNGHLISYEIGSYHSVHGFNFRNWYSKYKERRNLTGVTFTSFITLSSDFDGSLENYLKSDRDRQINTFDRFNERVLQHCRDFYNYSVNISRVTSWGYQLPNGSFDGMVGAAEHKIIDFGSSPAIFRADRLEKITYGRKTWHLKTAFLFLNPKSKSSIETYLRPLSRNVWYTTMGSVVIIIGVFETAFRIDKLIRAYRHQGIIPGTSLLLILGMFCQQGYTQAASLLSSKIMVISVLFLTMLLYQFYSASIVSFLLMAPVSVVNNLEELITSSLQVGCEDVKYVRDFFENTKDPVALQLYKKKILKPNNQSHFYPPLIGLENMKKGGYAFHVEAATAYPYIETTFSDEAICQLREIKLYDSDMHAVLQKHSPFKDMIDTCLQRLDEFGILKRQLTFWHPRKPECVLSAVSSIYHIGIEEIYPLLLILACGVGISIGILIFEIQMHKKSRYRSDIISKNKETVYPFTL